MSDESQPTLSIIAARARSILSSLVLRQVGAYAAQLSSATTELAGQIRDVGDEVATRRKSEATRDLADTIAQNTERVGTYLKSTDGITFLNDAQRYGREQPFLAALIALATGFAAARLLKVSAIGVGRTAS